MFVFPQSEQGVFIPMFRENEQFICHDIYSNQSIEHLECHYFHCEKPAGGLGTPILLNGDGGDDFLRVLTPLYQYDLLHTPIELANVHLRSSTFIFFKEKYRIAFFLMQNVHYTLHKGIED